MVGPSSQVSKLLLGLLVAVLIFFVYMDCQLYLRIQNYPVERASPSSTGVQPPTVVDVLVQNATSDTGAALSYADVTWFGCDISPLCDVTVKALLLDHTNHYIFGPAATILDHMLSISRTQVWITPNMISMGHVVVAAIAGNCVASDSLVSRRIGVVLFEVRTFLDDLDGHVARARKHVKGERSEIGTSGYYVDGLCDALGCIALIVGVFVFLRNNPPRRGYIPLQAILPTSSGSDCGGGSVNGADGGVIYKAKVTTKKVARKVACFAAQLLLSSTLWNRYIALYQDMLERTDGVTSGQYVRQSLMFRSAVFFCVAWLWRVVNVHNMIHILLLAIFCDKLWEFLRSVQYVGFVILICVICVTEMHVLEVQNFVFSSLTGAAAATST